MRFWLPAALLLLLEAISFAATACPGCQEIASAPPSGIFVLVRDSQESNRSLEIVAYYENESASPRRQPLRDSILIVEITNSTGLEVLRKTYTDANGTAAFSFTGWDKSCLNFKVLYCPYCLPADSDCAGFRQCLNFSHIESGAANAGEIEDAADAKAPESLNTAIYLPTLGTATWCPPPEPLKGTPEFCLPLILIFSLLSGALYITGRNPFSSFNIGAVKPGQHMRYQARARGWALNVTQIASTAVSLGQSIGSLASDPEKFKQQEASAITSRATMGMSGVHKTVESKKKSSVNDKAAKAGGKEGGKKSAQASGAVPIQAGGPKGGMQAGGGYGGREVVGKLGEAGLTSAEGVKALPEAVLKMAMFVVMSSSIGRVVDSAISAGTGKGLLSLIADKAEGRTLSVELEEAKAQKAAAGIHVPNSGPDGEDRITDVKREAAAKDGEGKIIGREITYSDTSGKSADGEMTVRYDLKGNVEWCQFTLAGADGGKETYRVSPAEGGRYDVAKMDPATGAPLLHLYGSEANKIADIASNNPISDLTRPGANANDFLEGDYAAFKEARNDLDRQVAALETERLKELNGGLNGQARSDEGDGQALDGLRDRYAAGSLAEAMGLGEDASRGLMGAAAPAQAVSAVADAMDKAGLVPGSEVTLDKVNAYKEAIAASDLPDFTKGSLLSIGVDKLDGLYEAGRLVKPESTGDLVSTSQGAMFVKDPSRFGPEFADTRFSNGFKAAAIEYERSAEVRASVSAPPADQPPPAKPGALEYMGLAPMPEYDGKLPETRNFNADIDAFQARSAHEADAIVAKIAFENLPEDRFPKASQNEALEALYARDRERLKAAFGGKD